MNDRTESLRDAEANALPAELQKAQSHLDLIRGKLQAKRQLLLERTEKLPHASRDRRQSDVALSQLQRERNAAYEAVNAAVKAARQETERLAQHAAAALHSLSRQQVDEVRYLAHWQPPQVVKRAFGLAYCLLHPEDVLTTLLQSQNDEDCWCVEEKVEREPSRCFEATDQLECELNAKSRNDTGTGSVPLFSEEAVAGNRSTKSYVKLDRLSWEDTLSPLLRRGELVRRILDFPPAGVPHPLLAFPRVRQLLLDNISSIDIAAATRAQSSRITGSGSELRTNSGSSGSKIRNSGNCRSRSSSITNVRGNLERGLHRSSSETLPDLVRNLRRSSSSASVRQNVSSRATGNGNNLAHRAESPSVRDAAPRNLAHRAESPSVRDAAPRNGDSAATFRRSSSETALGIGRKRTSEALLDNEGRLTMQAVQYASDAAGALYRWILAHLQYAQKMEETTGVKDLRVKAAQLEARFATASAVAKALQQQEIAAEAAMGSALREVTLLDNQEQQLQAIVADLTARIAEAKAATDQLRAQQSVRVLGPPSWARPVPKPASPKRSTERTPDWGLSRWNVHPLWQTGN